MAGTGKKTALHTALKNIAHIREIPFTIQMRGTGAIGATGDVTEAGATEEGADPEDSMAGQFMMETSFIHIGLDIARMSMQDKHILRPILANLGQGSQVMAGKQGRGSRILVLYHAHLLSSESVLLIQACLEQNEGDLSIWFTSELPVPQRIRDWFVEVPVGGEDAAFETFQTAIQGTASWSSIFTAIIDKWRRSPPPKIQDVKEVKAFVYEMLMRNLRWVEATHFILDVLLLHPDITEIQRKAAIGALATCEATGGGYTIPSYRIPIIWESLFLQLRTIFTNAVTDVAPSIGRVSKSCKKTMG
ncbi:hypothetical protein EBR66_02500 [bacterium]|nr:hypothetical protein [bacterium]